MREQKHIPYAQLKSFVAIGGAISALALGTSAWAANDLAHKAEAGGFDTKNMAFVGFNDLQGRVTYQTSIATQNSANGGRVIAYAGHFSAKMLNPMTGQIEINGTSIVDVTDPTNPIYLKHLPASNGGGRMNRICAGSDLPKGQKNHYYLLRENGSLSHEIWDVTTPENPSLVSTVITGQDTTHKNYWDCWSGLGYLVAGAGAKAPGGPDGWKVGQHTKVYDLSDPANPVFVVEHGLPGQNPVTIVGTPPAMIHGGIAVSKFLGDPNNVKNRWYAAYGVEANGIVQISDLTKLLPPPYGTGKYVDPHKPTDLELLQSEIGRAVAPGTIGGHTTWPVYGVEVTVNKNYHANTTMDLLMLTSEETSNRCTSFVHNLTIMDITADPAGEDSSAEQHPWGISSATVADNSGRPNFCSRGTRFGIHSVNENFRNDLYGKLVTSAWFDAGIRVTDIRDPYNPKEVGYFVYPINANTQPSNSTINGITYSQLDISCDNTEVDDDNLIYCGDRVGSGLYITRLTGPAAAIIGDNKATKKRLDKRLGLSK